MLINKRWEWLQIICGLTIPAEWNVNLNATVVSSLVIYCFLDKGVHDRCHYCE